MIIVEYDDYIWLQYNTIFNDNINRAKPAPLASIWTQPNLEIQNNNHGRPGSIFTLPFDQFGTSRVTGFSVVVKIGLSQSQRPVSKSLMRDMRKVKNQLKNSHFTVFSTYWVFMALASFSRPNWAQLLKLPFGMWSVSKFFTSVTVSNWSTCHSHRGVPNWWNGTILYKKLVISHFRIPLRLTVSSKILVWRFLLY